MPESALAPVPPRAAGLPPDMIRGAMALPAAGLARPARPRTLLLVEDSRHAAEAVRMLARRLGMRLRRAEDLAMARRHLQVYRPDVVLVDLGLPDGSGLELIADLAAARPRLRRIVAVSADPDAAAEARAAGACAFVGKPFRLPADLPALLGAEAPMRADLAAVPGERNAGADPLALGDDLRRALAILAAPPEQGPDYAAQFLRGIARCSQDAGLLAAVERARQSRAWGELVALLRERVAGARRAPLFLQ